MSGFDDSQAELIEMLGTVLVRRAYTGGETIFEKGDEAEEAFAVLKGEVDIVSKSAAGASVVLTSVKPGQFFGEMALLIEGARSAAAVAKHDCELLVLPRFVLDKKMLDASAFIKLWIRTLATRIVDVSHRVAR
ncbi:MAG: cyclic nucleotide-binding domain-containing protein [Rhodobacteraceae bacterium]|nr:cyclic nucleotide-binding domain-containing protein [Paracoccaceae bacterium]